MSPRHEEAGQDPEQPLDPDEQQVHDLLASVGRDTPQMPADVARRLDETLRTLVDEQAGTVTALEQRRRRWPQVLVAAAAVTVVGFGVGNLLTDGGIDLNTALNGSAGGSAAEDAGGAPQASGDARGLAADPASGRLARLSTDTLAVDVQRLADAALGAQSGDAPEATRDGPGPQALNQPRNGVRHRCAVPETARGEQAFAVRLDGAPATLVFGQARDGVRQADVYACGDPSAPVASTSVSVD